MPESLWPLPLTAFEEYMLRDDRATYPMSIVARLQLAGPLDRTAAAAAWEQTLARHQLLRAKVADGRKGRLEWTAAAPLPALQWNDRAAADQMPEMLPIDLRREAGARAWASSDARQSAVVLQVHHAACDGKAVLQVADDFLRSYAMHVGPTQADHSLGALPACDDRLLPARGKFGLTARKLLKMLPAQLSGLIGAGKFLLRQPVPLLSSADGIEHRLAERVPEAFPAVRADRLDAEELQRLTGAAAAQGVTVNDWLLRDFFLAIDDFRRRHERPSAGDCVRLTVPINLRQTTDARLPAANVVSMVFLDRTAGDFASPAQLLQGIHEEMALIRRRQLGLTFIWSLCLMQALPGGMAPRVGRRGCEATAVVSNLGRVLGDSPLPRHGGKIVAGNVLLEGVDLFAPVREGTAASVALVFYADELRICLQHDGRRMTAAEAGDLLATYLRTIRASIGGAQPIRHDKAA